MTRFARAKGSKASNERKEEESTPWHIMKQQFIDQLNAKTHPQNSKNTLSELKNIVNVKVNSDQEIWCDFGDEKKIMTSSKKRNKGQTDDYQAIKGSKSKRHKVDYAQVELSQNRSTSNKQSLKTNTVQIDKKNATDLNKDIQAEIRFEDKKISNKDTFFTDNKEENTSEYTHDYRPTQDINSRRPKHCVDGKPKKSSIVETTKSHLGPVDFSSKETMALCKKKKKKEALPKASPDTKEENEIKVNNTNTQEEVSCITNETQNKFIQQKSTKVSKEKKTTGKTSNEDKSVNYLENLNTKQNSNCNKKSTNTTVDIQNQSIVKNKRNKTNFHNAWHNYNAHQTIIANGREIKIVSYEGFLIKKDDAAEIRKLRKKLKAQKIHKEKINAIIKLERRKAEKALAREKKSVCFHCRQFGHNFNDCPDIKDTEMSKSGMCFKCGSLEHSYFECKVLQNQSFRFAVCFVCKEQGHIARQCKLNPHGQYPKGGSCHLCGEITHLRKDCPKAIDDKPSNLLTVDKLSNNLLEDISEETLPRSANKIKKKIVTF